VITKPDQLLTGRRLQRLTMHVMLGPAWKLLLTAQLLLLSALQLQTLTMPSEVAATSCSGLRQQQQQHDQYSAGSGNA
jgi:hypothetical protein